MVHPQHGHVGAPPGPALADDPRGDVKDAHKTHRARGLSAAAAHRRPPGTQAREREPRPTAGLLDERGVAQRLKDAVGVAPHVIGDGEDETGGQLPQGGARARKGGRIGHKAKSGDQVVEGSSRPCHITLPRLLDGGDVGSDSVKHLLDRLGRLAVRSLAQVAALEHGHRILGQPDA